MASAKASQPLRTSPSTSAPAAGQKRKRVPEKKFYAVRQGKTPGIYDTWAECLSQVRGQKGALFKAFSTLPEAQAFVEGRQLEPTATTPTSEPKFYAVQNGRKPGVYMDWPSAQAQIRGFPHPRHKKFATRSEAELFVAAGKKMSAYDAPQDSTAEEEVHRLMAKRSAPGLVLGSEYQPKDKQGTPYELGKGPLPPGAEDGFDPNLRLTSDGKIVARTEQEKQRTKFVPREREPPGMLRIYTDGSSLRNGQAGARAGVGVFFGPQHPKNVSEALKGSKQTNQRAELTAILRALNIAPLHREVTIYTDSKYSIDCVTNWYRNWERNGWVNTKGKPVENRDLVQDIREKMEEREMLGRGTFFVWVKGHANDEGNIAADRLANEGALKGRDGENDSDDADSVNTDDLEKGTMGNGDGDSTVDAEDEFDGEDDETEQSFKMMWDAMRG